MPYQHYLFDLDGTLTDPGLGIKNSIRYALKKFGLPSLTEGELDAFVGPPLMESFEKYCGVDREKAMEMVLSYREYFAEKGIFENRLYDDVEETLRELVSRGAKLYVATSKPEVYAKTILSHFEIDRYFTFVGGSTMAETRTKKAEVVAHVLKSMNIDPKKESCVMVGDRIYDIQGGKDSGLDTIGVLFGYGGREELSSADHLIASFDDLLEL